MVSYSYYKTDHRIIKYAESLVKIGYNVDVFCLKMANDNHRREQVNGVNVFYVQSRKYNENNILSYFIKILSFFIIGSVFLFLRHLKYHYRIIHIHNVPDFLIFMAFMPKLFRVKLILDIHDILPEFYCQKFQKEFSSNLVRLLLMIENLSVHFADHIIVANDIWNKKIQTRTKSPPHKFTTILNYPEKELLVKRLQKQNKSNFTIIYPGTLSYLHGVDIAVKAMSLVKKTIPIAQLLIYHRSGNEDYYNWIKELIDIYSLETNVQLINPVPYQQLNQIYQDVDIGVVPKRCGIFSSEAFSTKIFDFMASKIPIIASRTKVEEYYFDDSLIMFFKSEDHEDLARCIIELYYDKKKRTSLVTHADQYIRKNTWIRKKETYNIIINKLINK